MLKKTLVTAALLTLISTVACAPDETFVDQGAVCLGVPLWEFWDEPKVLLKAGEEVEVKVVFSECISTCAVDIKTSCSIEAGVDGYVIHSSASYRERGSVCNTGCQELETTCGTITVEEETRLRHGDFEHVFVAGEEGSCAAPPRPESDGEGDLDEEDEAIAFDTPSGSFCTQTAPEPNEPFSLLFRSDQCLSSSCTESYYLRCDLAVDGQDVTASVEGSYFDASNRAGRVCDDDCGTWAGRCEELILPEGTYTLEYAGESYELNVPGEAQTCL